MRKELNVSRFVHTNSTGKYQLDEYGLILALRKFGVEGESLSSLEYKGYMLWKYFLGYTLALYNKDESSFSKHQYFTSDSDFKYNGNIAGLQAAITAMINL